MKDFVHLHVHTEYSLLDGATKIDEIFGHIKELGQKAVAITDHGNMYGTLYFAELAKKAGIKPLIGCEMYMCEDMNAKNGRGDNNLEHLVLIAKNKKGYKNLIKLDSAAFVDGFYYKPRIDYKYLENKTEGLICLSACLAGKIPQYLLRNDYEGAKKTAKKFVEMFGEDFYLEVQDHGLAEQKYILPSLFRLGKELNIKIVATNDVHYLTKPDAEMQDVMLCINTKKTINDTDRMRFGSDEFYLKSGDEMSELFPNNPEVLENTLEVADKVTEEVFNLTDEGNPIRDSSLIPGYVPENGQTPYEFLKQLGLDGLTKRYPVITDEIRKRFDYELETIRKMGFLEYYLIVWDFINFAKQNGIPVGVGRGSGVGSIIAYSVGITGVDPLKYNLLFERFLNIERVSMPDFDIDFCTDRRQEVIEYVRKKYGSPQVAQIVTFGTLASKAAIKDVARVYNLPFSESNKITKLMDGKASIKESLGIKPNKDGVDVSIPDLKALYNEDEQLKKIMDMAMRVEDLPKNTSMHAAGVVICSKPIADNVPLSRNGDDITTQFDMKEIEALGMLKMDFLALRTLTDVKKAIDYIKEDYGVDIDFLKLGYEDKGAYEIICDGETDAVFQLESIGMKRFMKQLRPTNIEDIIAGISLFRPGPMDSIPKYLKFREDESKMTYKHPMLEPILKVTMGTIIYQEQVMEIVQRLAGYSLGQADIIRRAMSKKKPAEMEMHRGYFVNGKAAEKGKPAIEGAISRGVPKEVAEEIFDEMASFASYAFNKSHAAAYAVLAYQTAYLKKYYPQEFLCAVLNNRIDKIAETTKYIMYCKEKGIEVLPPDINKSFPYFRVVGKSLIIGLVAVKGVGLQAISDIIAEREKGGEFSSFESFITRCSKHLNKRIVENLILAGAFDCFKVYRSRLLRVYEGLLERVAQKDKMENSNQISFFGSLIEEDFALSVDYPEIEELDKKDLLQREKSVLGVYITGHPLENYMEKFKNFNFNTNLLEYYDEDENGDRTYVDIKNDMQVTMGGIVSSFTRKTTKSGNIMGIISLEDVYGQVECVLFSKTFEKYKNTVQPESIVKLTGRLQIKDNMRPSILVDKIEDYLETPVQTEIKLPGNRDCVALLISSENEKRLDEIYDILQSYEGTSPVYMKIGESKKLCDVRVRRCEALKYELQNYLEPNEIIFFTK